MIKPRPEVLVLDVNETLSDLEPMRDRFERVGLPAHALDAWFAATLRDGFALTAAGAFPSFRDVAGDALPSLLASQGVTEADFAAAIEQVLASLNCRHIPMSLLACTGSMRPGSG